MIPIIIINWNGIQDTKECIESLLKSNYEDFRIHLIDNGSDEQEVEALSQLYDNHAKVTLHLNSKNLGFTKAHIKIYNEFLSKQDCRYIALLNNDTVVDKNWLTALLDTADQQEADMVSSKMISYFNRDIIDNTGHKMLNTGEILPIGHGESISLYNEEVENFGACAGACLYSKKMIEEIGFFDPYFSTGYEDAEFGLRAMVAGYKSVYSPKAIVYHKMGQSVKKIFNFEYSAMIQTSILYSYFKNVPGINLLLSMPFLFIKNVILFIINILFLRKKFLMVQIKSWVTIINSHRTIIIKRKASKELRKNTIPVFEFVKKTKFFLLVDIKRFWNIFILKKESAIDSY